MPDNRNQYEFGAFRLDPLNRLLTRNGKPVALAPRVFDTLVALVRLRGRVVTKDELFRAVWSDSFVEESNLTVTISALRKALNDGEGKQKYVQTVPKFGYRFVADVRDIVATEAVFTEHPEGVPPPTPEQDAAIELRPLRPTGKASWVALAAAFVLVAGFALASLMPPTTWRPDHASLAMLPASARVPCVAEQDSITKGGHSSEVQALYLKGRYSSSRGTERGLEHSVAYFSNAIAKDPCNAMAYAGLADVYLSLPSWSIQSPTVAYRKAKEAVGRAVELDNSLSQAHTTLGMLVLVRDWNFAVAEKECRRGVELGPNESLAHQGLGIYLATRGRLQDALKEMRIARDLDPLSLDIGMKLGLILYYLRQYPEAIAEYKKVIDLDPHYSVSHYGLGVTYFVQRDFEDAARELKESSGLVNDREPLAFGLYAASRGRMGDEATAAAVRAELEARSRKEYISPASLAVFYIGLGKLDEVPGWLNRMFQDHLLEALLVNVDPFFDPVRGDPRFVALVRTLTDKSGTSIEQGSAKPGSAWLHLPRN